MARLKDSGSKLAQATMRDDRHGEKSVLFKVLCKDTVKNNLVLHVIEDNGRTVNKVFADKDLEGLGNDVAVAMDILTNMELPLGTQISIRIDFTLPEDKQ